MTALRPYISLSQTIPWFDECLEAGRLVTKHSWQRQHAPMMSHLSPNEKLLMLKFRSKLTYGAVINLLSLMPLLNHGLDCVESMLNTLCIYNVHVLGRHRKDGTS